MLLPEDYLAGQVILIDKPLHWTSFNVVSKIKSLLRHRAGIKKIKVGHAGTLDPLATGLLIICTGKMTRSIEQFQALPKEYTGTFFIGATTPSSDLETQPGEPLPIEHINEQLALETAKTFLGKIQQVPPLFSAKKIEGKRAYDHARQGSTMELKPNEVTIHDFHITRFELPEIDFLVRCSKGTYIRSLARDFGTALQSGAYLKTLRRTKIGDFFVDQAQSPDKLEQMFVHKT
jgi:tRNA pseudouridine55 synthase